MHKHPFICAISTDPLAFKDVDITNTDVIPCDSLMVYGIRYQPDGVHNALMRAMGDGVNSHIDPADMLSAFMTIGSELAANATISPDLRKHISDIMDRIASASSDVAVNISQDVVPHGSLMH